MLKISYLTEQGYRNTIECDTLAYANYYFKQKQNDNMVMITMLESEKPIKFAEKINLKWYVSELA